MEFKYSLNPAEPLVLDDFHYIGNNIWVLSDNQFVYSYSRDNANFTLIDKVPHYNSSQSNYMYHIIKLDNNDFVLGHHDETQGITFSVDGNGNLINKTFVDLPIKSTFNNHTYYNSDQKQVINMLENKIYSTETFEYTRSFDLPYYPTGISNNGTLVLGSNNDPEWQVTDNSLHKKETKIFNLTSNFLDTKVSIGYPLLLFENHLGQIISISSGFKRKSLHQENPKKDLFIEIIN